MPDNYACAFRGNESGGCLFIFYLVMCFTVNKREAKMKQLKIIKW